MQDQFENLGKVEESIEHGPPQEEKDYLNSQGMHI